MNAHLTLFALSLAVLFSGCSMQSTNMLSNNTFVLSGSESLKDSFPAGYPTLTFTDSTTFSGYSGCNRIFGTFTTKENAIAFSNMGMTKMFCVNVAEDWFLQHLETVDSYTYKDSMLNLYGKEKLLLVFRLQPK